MPVRTSYPHGMPCWVELATNDVGAAKGFYAGLFGWSYREDPLPQGGVYVTALLDGKSVGGLWQTDPAQGIHPNWGTHINVDDVDAAAAAAAEAGATIMMGPFDVMDVGRMAVLSDPTGAVVSFWQAKTSIGAEVVNEHGAFTWNEVHTGDVDRATAFYGTVLGWTPDVQQMPTGPYTMFVLDGAPVAGAMATQPEEPPNWLSYFTAADIAATAAAVASGGGQVLFGPQDIGAAGSIAVCMDPQGAAFGLNSPPPAS